MANKIIAIGGLGGSGTRVLAEIFIKSGLFMGSDLNHAADNFLFTKLFKNPEWYLNAPKNAKGFRLKIFEKYMTGQRLKPNEILETLKASYNNKIVKHNFYTYTNWLKSGIFKRSSNLEWGWKEPNTHLYLSEIMDYFSNLIYIHVLRHGLDMAFSSNKQQLAIWGQNFGCDLSGSETELELTKMQLKYWIKTTKEVLRKQDKYPDRIYIFNHSNFCEQPNKEIEKLFTYCQIPFKKSLIIEHDEKTKLGAFIGRYKEKKIDIFDPDQLAFVARMGFDISE